MATLQNFGEQFSAKVLQKFYAASITASISNRDYEGEIKKPGDRLNILSFLNSVTLSDYVVGSDMPSETIVDAEDQLVVEKRKSYNFSLDHIENIFTYGGDIPESLLTDAAKVLERLVDTYVLDKMAQNVKAGSWIGTNLVVVGSGQTMASIVTTTTGGTVNINGYAQANAQEIGAVENPVDGATYFGGFEQSDVFKGFRLRSTAAFVSPWYRIATVTNSVTATLTEWDGATAGSDFEEGMTLRGLFGGDGTSFPKYGSGDASLLTMSGLGWEIQAAIATAVTAATIYNQTTLLAEALNTNEIPAEDRKLTVPPTGTTMLKQATQLQPTGIAEIFTGTVIQGRVMRFGGFTVFEAQGARVSTRVGHSTAAGALAPDVVLTPGALGWVIPANHTGHVTYAEKWSETRVKEAENQFANKYQGLFLFGATVPAQRRKFASALFGSF